MGAKYALDHQRGTVTPTPVQVRTFNSSFFETGAMLTPTKSQNGTNCGSGGSFQSYLTHS